MKIGTMATEYISFYGKERGYEKIAEHGYNCVDAQFLANTDGELFKLNDAEFERNLLADRALVTSLGLEFSQSHGPWRYPPKDDTPEDRAERFEKMSRAIRGTAYLGAKNIVLHCIMPYGARIDDKLKEKHIEINREFFCRLLDVAREYDVIISLENLPFLSLPISRPKETLSFVKSMNSPYMRMCLDTGHSAVFGDSPADSVRMIGKEYLTALHVHDNDGRGDKHQEPGLGIIDWSDFSKALHEINFEGTVSLETGVPGTVTDPAERDKRERNLADKARRIANGKW